jgi:copper resistance protein C
MPVGHVRPELVQVTPQAVRDRRRICEDGHMISRRFATVVTLVIVVAFVVVAVAPAFAATPAALPLHARLVGSTPQEGSTVDTAEQVTLAFNEDVDPTFVKVTVEGPDGSETDGPPSVSGRETTQPLAADLPAGEHVVTYRVVSTDGHPVSGTLTFTTTAAPIRSPEPTASATPSPSATASAAPSPTASASPTASPSPTATAPASDDAGFPWSTVLIVLAALLTAVGLAVSWRHHGGPAADAEADPAADARTEDPADEDPYVPGRDAGRDPFA